MLKTITVKHYPDTFCFHTKTELPDFEYGCRIRSAILRYELKKQKIHSPCHAYEDYIVEDVENEHEEFEIWVVGS